MLSKIALASLVAAVSAAGTASVKIGANTYELTFAEAAAGFNIKGPDATVVIQNEYTCEGTTTPLTGGSIDVVAAGVDSTLDKYAVVGRAAKVGEACGVITSEGTFTATVAGSWGDKKAVANLKNLDGTDAAGMVVAEWETQLTSTISGVSGGDVAHGLRYTSSACGAALAYTPNADFYTVPVPEEVPEEGKGDVFKFGGDANDEAATITYTENWTGIVPGATDAAVYANLFKAGEAAPYLCAELKTVAAVTGTLIAEDVEGKKVKVVGTLTGAPAGSQVTIVKKTDDTDVAKLSCSSAASIGADIVTPVDVPADGVINIEFTVNETEEEFESVENFAVVVRSEGVIAGCGVVGGEKDTAGGGDDDKPEEPNDNSGAAATTVSVAAMTIMGAALMN